MLQYWYEILLQIRSVYILTIFSQYCTNIDMLYGSDIGVLAFCPIQPIFVANIAKILTWNIAQNLGYLHFNYILTIFVANIVSLLSWNIAINLGCLRFDQYLWDCSNIGMKYCCNIKDLTFDHIYSIFVANIVLILTWNIDPILGCLDFVHI